MYSFKDVLIWLFLGLAVVGIGIAVICFFVFTPPLITVIIIAIAFVIWVGWMIAEVL